MSVPASLSYIGLIAEKSKALKKFRNRYAYIMSSKGISSLTIKEGAKKVNNEIMLVEGGLKKLLKVIMHNIEELEKTIRLLETQLARIEIDYVAGELNEEKYLRDKDVITSSINILKERLESIRDVIEEKTPELIREYERILQKATVESILEELPENRAFYFYVDYGKYTGKYAKSLEEFSKMLDTLDARSIRFHLKRRDFQKWIKDLGDTELSKILDEIEIDKLTDIELMEEVSRKAKARVKTLKEMLKKR
ncbi:TPA: hypothetical protein EYP70_06310 [Candidatus Bathyarchaeota archaeon]|nr:hypothetical protein [Candidatus Bathyarchaeota archaeon]